MKILKLRGKMVEKGMNVESLASAMDIDRATLYRKLNDGEKFTIGDAKKIKTALDLTDEEANDIFFGK
jgi:plasmid maintenance system antidote protein VapI